MFFARLEIKRRFYANTTNANYALFNSTVLQLEINPENSKKVLCYTNFLYTIVKNLYYKNFIREKCRAILIL